MKKFSFYRAPASSVTPYKDISIYQAYLYITGKYAREQTEQLRSITDPKLARTFKCSHFDFATFSGTFTTRRDDALVEHSGLLCLDFDHLSDAGHLTATRSVLLQDPCFETLLLFTSPSGTGLKWVISIDMKKCDHRTWFTAVRNYLAATYHLDADRACINVSRSCFLPHDPDCYIAPRLHEQLATTDEQAGKEGLLVNLAKNLCATINIDSHYE